MQILLLSFGSSTRIEKVHVPTGHLRNELYRDRWTLNTCILQRFQRPAAIEARFSLQILIVKRHLLLKERFQFRHRRFQKRTMADELNSLDMQDAANVRKPESVLRRYRIRQMIRTAVAVGSA